MKEKRVLIIEDEDALRMALCHKFGAVGFACTEARNGKEALHVFPEARPDIILLDIELPVIDGLTFLKTLKGDEHTKAIPVIVLTNFADVNKISEVLACGVHEYLVKADWQLNDIVRKVEDVLNASSK